MSLPPPPLLSLRAAVAQAGALPVAFDAAHLRAVENHRSLHAVPTRFVFEPLLANSKAVGVRMRSAYGAPVFRRSVPTFETDAPAPSGAHESIPELRRRLRRARRNLGATQQRRHAARAASLLIREGLCFGVKRISFYFPADGELDPRPLIEGLPRGNRRCYLPLLRPQADGGLWFAEYRRDTALRPNRFGILEPVCRRRRIVPARFLGLVLMPLVGFDADCNRIGMGGGYYDRSFAFLRARQHWQRPLLVGLAHECQRIERIEPRAWDLALDAIMTETRVYRRPASTAAPKFS